MMVLTLKVVIFFIWKLITFIFSDTIAEDELHEIDVEGELADLQAEAEMDIEELRRKYYSTASVEAEHAGSSEAANPDAEVDEAETSHSELYDFIQAENGEVEGYDSDEDADFDVTFYKPPRVGSAFQVSFSYNCCFIVHLFTGNEYS